MQVGDRVRVSAQHWLRPNAVGVIVEFDGKRGDHHWLVAFDPEVGHGFDKGRCLWLGDNNLSVEPPRKGKTEREQIGMGAK